MSANYTNSTNLPDDVARRMLEEMDREDGVSIEAPSNFAAHLTKGPRS